MSPRRRVTSALPPGPVTPADRQVEHLVVIRESSLSNRSLMLGMIQQTMARVGHLPGAVGFRDAGLDIFDNPMRYGGIARRIGKSTTVTVEVDGTLYFFSMGTAAKDDEGDTNAFVRTLTEMINEYRPREVWAVAFTRLLRAVKHSGGLLAAVQKNVEILHCETEIQAATPEGQTGFVFLSLIASIERDNILRRHTSGRVVRWQRGEWPHPTCPVGYRIDVDRRLVVDEPMVEPVRRLLQNIANPALTARQIAAAAAAEGITTTRVQQYHPDGATIGDLHNPREAILTIAGWAETYRTGVYELLWPNPFPGVAEFVGIPVEESEDRVRYPCGALRFSYQLPLPEGGWADDATIDAVSSVGERRSPTGAGARDDARTLSGFFRFKEGEHEYAMVSLKQSYVLLQRARDDDQRYRGWRHRPEDRPQRVATIPRVVLHQSIGESIVRAIEEGVPAYLDTQRFVATGGLPRLSAATARLRALRAELADLVKQVPAAVRNAELARDVEDAGIFVQRVVELESRKRDIEGEIERLEREQASRELGPQFESVGDMVVKAVSGLLLQSDRINLERRQALRTVVSGERMVLDPATRTVRWSLFLELPHAEGTVVVGPISGEVPNHSRIPRTLVTPFEEVLDSPSVSSSHVR